VIAVPGDDLGAVSSSSATKCRARRTARHPAGRSRPGEAPPCADIRPGGTVAEPKPTLSPPRARLSPTNGEQAPIVCRRDTTTRSSGRDCRCILVPQVLWAARRRGRETWRMPASPARKRGTTPAARPINDCWSTDFPREFGQEAASKRAARRPAPVGCEVVLAAQDVVIDPAYVRQTECIRLTSWPRAASAPPFSTTTSVSAKSSAFPARSAVPSARRPSLPPPKLPYVLRRELPHLPAWPDTCLPSKGRGRSGSVKSARGAQEDPGCSETPRHCFHHHIEQQERSG